VTDAGTPGVSDPGQALVEAAIRHSLPIVPIPGASAVVAALAASGLASSGRFRFFGFLPRAGRARRDAIATICETPEAAILFESPRRTHTTLLELAEHAPTRPVCVARELTKLHEEFVRGSLHDLASDVRAWQGEVTIVLGAQDDAKDSVASESPESIEELDTEIDHALARGERSREIAARLAAQSGLPKRTLYARIVARTAK
jgi:16S rRNA (cytidine1402-2'-O)-methyltransferase